MSDRGVLLEKCDEVLAFLVEHDGGRKLRRLMADIEELRSRLRAELNGSRSGSSDSTDEAAS